MDTKENDKSIFKILFIKFILEHCFESQQDSDVFLPERIIDYESSKWQDDITRLVSYFFISHFDVDRKDYLGNRCFDKEDLLEKLKILMNDFNK